MNYISNIKLQIERKEKEITRCMSILKRFQVKVDKYESIVQELKQQEYFLRCELEKYLTLGSQLNKTKQNKTN